ncbi:hypothetical protein [Gordoniibacillus kamchatkensis]|uniref:hypothetical protein n=1 Tax=Gordoniibacillus kamchatkensis TaxID=1590651 RepID=UPI000A6BAAC8
MKFPPKSGSTLRKTWNRFVFASLLALLLPAVSAYAESDHQHQKGDLRQAALNGPTIEIDPTFLYYQNRSEESIADEMVQNGFKAVHYFVVNESNVNVKLIEAFHKRGIAVWALVLGNGSYSVVGYPADWPEWQMQLLTPVNDGFYRFSPFSDKYVAWKKKSLATLVTKYPFDGIEVAEPYFPEWDGIKRGVYGDVGPLAQEAFKKEYGLGMPNFTNPNDPNYYETNRELYEKWIEFRVNAVNRFVEPAY